MYRTNFSARQRIFFVCKRIFTLTLFAIWIEWTTPERWTQTTFNFPSNSYSDWLNSIFCNENKHTKATELNSDNKCIATKVYAMQTNAKQKKQKYKRSRMENNRRSEQRRGEATKNLI